MQRQSLGSPSSKLEIHGGNGSLNKEEKRKSSYSSPADSSPSTSSIDVKAEKPIRPNSKSERSIHLIPFLIIVCFAILYLFSHEPSTEDLSSFGGISRLVNRKGVWGHRALKEEERFRHRRRGPP